MGGRRRRRQRFFRERRLPIRELQNIPQLRNRPPRTWRRCFATRLPERSSERPRVISFVSRSVAVWMAASVGNAKADALEYYLLTAKLIRRYSSNDYLFCKRLSISLNSNLFIFVHHLDDSKREGIRPLYGIKRDLSVRAGGC